MYAILLVFHVLTAVVLVGLILIQQGKGAQAGAAFGSGASQTVFGSQGSGGFLSRATGILAAFFFILNLMLVFWINRSDPSRDHLAVPVTQAPAKTTEASEGAQGTSLGGSAGTEVPNLD